VLLVSGHFIYTGRVGGAEHMVYNLVRGLHEANAELTVLCSQHANLSAQFIRDCQLRNVPLLERGGNTRSRFLNEQRACFDPKLSSQAIIFPNYFLPPVAPKRLGKTAVVIHDFQYLHYPQYFSRRKRAWLWLSHLRAMLYADHVIFISEFVRRDAMRLFGSKAARGVAISNPISWDRFGERGLYPGADENPYILSVAAHYPHKQLDILLRAFAIFGQRHKDFRLVLVGQLANNLVSVSGSKGALENLITELGIGERVIVTGYVDDHKLGNLYRHAAAFAFPSAFEGFGMPAVEALGFGVPCLTTRCTALPETTLGFADYVDEPANVDEWAARLATLVEKPRLPGEKVRWLRHRYDPATIGRQYLMELQLDHQTAANDIFKEENPCSEGVAGLRQPAQ
jgi:glycosyltransferase involved in cell wall biosynthesis